jgi:hypothetical protein
MTPEFGINFPQTVKHISQKAFFKHALEAAYILLKDVFQK